MDDFCYQIPIQFSRFFGKKPLPKCNLETSIQQNILLILLSHFEEYRFDHTFGCSLWEEDFELLPSANVWKEHLQRSIHESLARHEPRLNDIKIKVAINEVPFTHPEDKKVRRIKKRIGIEIRASISLTGEPFSHAETIFFSPISLD